MSIRWTQYLGLGALALSGSWAFAQELTVEPPKEEKRSADQASVRTRPNARTMTLSIPAPRGQITDRYGKPLAQNKVVWYPALQFKQFAHNDRAKVVAWARRRIAKANEVFEIDWQPTDEELWQHYRHRRWLAYPYTHVVEGERKELLEKKLMEGLVLHPLYQRVYPQSDLAAHIIGYVGSKGKLEKGPINYGDPIFEFTEGRAGLEKLFDKQLTGRPGFKKLQYDSDGTELQRETTRRPRPGGSVITTIDLEWQKHAEEVLAKRCKRGALVVVDVHTGEVLTMASRPSYDLNTFVPFISTKEYDALRLDEARPLYARAFQGVYPPASTFKVVVALAALNDYVINEHTLIDCPAFIQLGKHKMHNWSKKDEGQMNVVHAIARSNNPWFIQVAITIGHEKMLGMAKRLGYGKKSGLPLVGEAAGLIPDDKYMRKHHKRRITDGDTANLAIGQGVMLATPLQVARGMAGIANGGVLPKLQLVKQVQDTNGRVLMANRPDDKNRLNLDPLHVSLVQEGMMQVVNMPYGTGKRAAISYTVVCGKTGTGQWGPESKEQKVGWFTGFFPLDNPRYAFAAVYEGEPGEKVSGGSKAGPMVPDFFEPMKTTVLAAINPPARAVVVTDEELNPPSGDEQPAMAVPVEDGVLIPVMDDPPMAIPVEDNEVSGDDAPLPPMAIPVEDDAEPAELGPTGQVQPSQSTPSDEPTPVQGGDAPMAIPVDEP